MRIQYSMQDKTHGAATHPCGGALHSQLEPTAAAADWRFMTGSLMRGGTWAEWVLLSWQRPGLEPICCSIMGRSECDPSPVEHQLGRSIVSDSDIITTTTAAAESRRCSTMLLSHRTLIKQFQCTAMWHDIMIASLVWLIDALQRFHHDIKSRFTF